MTFFPFCYIVKPVLAGNGMMEKAFYKPSGKLISLASGGFAKAIFGNCGW